MPHVTKIPATAIPSDIIKSNTSITVDAVKKVAKLARLSSQPTSKFVKAYTDELSGILASVDMLKEVDISTIDSLMTNQTVTLQNLRADTPHLDNVTYDRVRTNIIHNFPHKQGNLLILPGIFEE